MCIMSNNRNKNGFKSPIKLVRFPLLYLLNWCDLDMFGPKGNEEGFTQLQFVTNISVYEQKQSMHYSKKNFILNTNFHCVYTILLT